MSIKRAKDKVFIPLINSFLTPYIALLQDIENRKKMIQYEITSESNFNTMSQE
jgi:hypothetical protein